MKNRKHIEQQFCRQKRAVNERGQRRRARLAKADRKVRVTQITRQYNSGMQKCISEHTMCQTFKWIGYNSRRSISLKNKYNKYEVLTECTSTDLAREISSWGFNGSNEDLEGLRERK